jgi:tRNA threonylcarbamoyladenosine biosynthesis protein TsaE
MSTATTLQISTTSSEATEQLGEQIGKALRGGEVIELVSDLGGGKTTLARGLARGTGSTDKVGSPTFTISKFYKTKDFDIHHFDFYRLAEAGIVADEIAEVANDPNAVVLVEWGEIVHHVLPKERVTITIRQTPTGSRRITLHAPKSLNYIIEGIK